MESQSDEWTRRQIFDTIDLQTITTLELKTQVTSELSNLKQEVHGSSAQVKKCKSAALVKW